MGRPRGSLGWGSWPVLAAFLLTGCSGDSDTSTGTAPPPPPVPASVTVSPATVELRALGATVRLSAEVRDQNGQAMAGATVAWNSSDASVATVVGSGLVTAVANGAATITAAAGSASGMAAVTVAQEVSAVTISPAADTLVVADTVRLSAEAADANGHAVAGVELAWESSDAGVAAVDDSGFVTGVAAGAAEISASSSGVTGRAQVAVLAPVPTTVAVTPDTVVLIALGQTQRLSAQVRDQIGRPMDGVPVSWSSGDTLVAAVDSGLVTAVRAGATVVTATAGEATGMAVVMVMQSAGSVVVSPAADTVAAGDTLRLAAEAFDENGHRVGGAEFRWSSSDASVAAVDASGLVTGVAEGMAEITAEAEEASGASEITVETPDRAALVALYRATDGPNWVNNENWLSDAPLGEWYGVDTDGFGRVVGLDLSGRWDSDEERLVRHGLTGSIPPQLATLGRLKRLSLIFNSLTGPIPAEFGKMGDLTELSLTSNNLAGPIPPEFGNLTQLKALHLDGNGFSGPIPPELGRLANLESLGVESNALTGPIPAELGRLTNLRVLWLWNNRLTGPIPPELGHLVNLEGLDVSYNSLGGLIPRSLLELTKLTTLKFGGNSGLCAPGTSVFATWLDGIEHRDETAPFCNESDMKVLDRLYQISGGPSWTNSSGWLETPVLDEWYGLDVDSLGRVVALDLSANGLAGRLPPNVGELARMTELKLADNSALSGRLPLSLTLLPLQSLHYSGTGLCAPTSASFRDWLSAVPSHEGTGDCAPLQDREVLEALYEATGGQHWIHKENWLTDAPLGEWYGVDVDSRGRVVGVRLFANDLKGRIPLALGELANLEVLDLHGNDLTGPIPPALGDIAELQWLDLQANSLTGPIPSELGSLANLEGLVLNENDLTGRIPPEIGTLASLWILELNATGMTGAIPPELGDLSNLGWLDLGRNGLTGSVPPELGGLANVGMLDLAANGLTDSIPPELGNLANLEELYLGENSFSGPVPPEFGGLTNLRRLALQTNAAMSGALPLSLTDLAALESFHTGGTGLCAPSDVDFLEWLKGVPIRRVAACAGEPAAAYLVQAVQSREFPVPLVAGEEALLRVFPTATQATSEGIPTVRARFFVDGRETHMENIPGKSDPIPAEVDESSLSTSANAVIPGRVIHQGLEMVIEVDPDGTLDPGLGVARRIPETGRLAVDVRDMPLFDLTLVPFLWTAKPDSAVLESVGGMAADPEGHELLAPTRTLLPVGELQVTAHEPVLSSSNNAFDLLGQTDAIRVMEGGTGYWMGMMSGRVTGAGGVAVGEASFSVNDAGVIGHEFGHNFSLPHAPCGGAGDPDPAYPTPDGTVGVWGYDFDAHRLVPPTTEDIMGYCGGRGIADYFFTKALHFRLAAEGAQAAAIAAHRPRSLLLWGGADSGGELHLNPAFVVDAPPALPRSGGDYGLTGRAADGRELLALRFDMPGTADGDGSAFFAFALPADPTWAADLVSLTLDGPGGSVTLDGETDFPMAILRDSRTGRVRGFLRDPPPATQAAMDAAGPGTGPGLEVLFSPGIPRADAWGR